MILDENDLELYKKNKRKEMNAKIIKGIIRNSTLALLSLVLVGGVFNIEIVNTSKLVMVSILIGGVSFCFTGIDILDSKTEDNLIMIKLIEETFILNNVLVKIEAEFNCKGIIEETRKEFYELKEERISSR